MSVLQVWKPCRRRSVRDPRPASPDANRNDFEYHSVPPTFLKRNIYFMASIAVGTSAIRGAKSCRWKSTLRGDTSRVSTASYPSS